MPTDPAVTPAEAEEEEVEYGDGDDQGDYVLFDGETYFYGGKDAFCEEFGAAVLVKDEGVTMVGVVGKGLISLSDFLRDAGKGAKLRPVN